MNQQPQSRLTTEDSAYTQRLQRYGGAWWKRVLDVQASYRRHLRSLRPGFTLDVGCGLGRNLGHLAGQGIWVDHNRASVEVCRQRGLVAFTPAEFERSEFHTPGRFDFLLLSHGVEHLKEADAVSIVRGYALLVKRGGKLILITPQEAGFRSDPTHVEFMDLPVRERIARQAGFEPARAYSFPFPRPVGHLFTYNEFVCVSVKGAAARGAGAVSPPAPGAPA